MEVVAVLMSTYNGEKYIQEQLDSILQQEDVIPYIFVRDDGSDDDTYNIILKYERTYRNVFFVNKCCIENKGIKHSFLELLQYALNLEKKINYFAFADQDDVWLPGKLKDAVENFKNIKPYSPGLYFSNKTFVDRNLNVIFEEKQKFYNDFYSLFHNTGASGCTMVFNRVLASLVARFIPQYTILHDQWVFRVAHCTGATFFNGEQSFILYRQHENNVCGIDACNPNKHNWKGLFKKKNHLLQKALIEIDDNYKDYVSDESKRYLKLIRNYRHNFRSKIALAVDPLAFQRGLKSYFFWLLTLIRETI